LRQFEVIKRNKRFVAEIKDLYNNTCQICGIQLKIKNNLFYSEVHHIKPLGIPHNGNDNKYNMICVCPNDHILLDLGAIPLVSENLILQKHTINEEFINYYMKTIYRE